MNNTRLNTKYRAILEAFIRTWLSGKVEPNTREEIKDRELALTLFDCETFVELTRHINLDRDEAIYFHTTCASWIAENGGM